MTAQMDVERTEEAKQSHFKLAYGALLASLLVIWGGCYIRMLNKSYADEYVALEAVLWALGLLGMAVSIVFMWRAYDRNSDHGLCMKFGIAFLVLNLVVFGVFVLAAFETQEKYDGDDTNKEYRSELEPKLWTFCFAIVTAVICVCGCVAMCAFPRPRLTPCGFEKVPPHAV